MEIKIIAVKNKNELVKIEKLGKIIWNECYAQTISQEQIKYMLDKFQSLDAMQLQIEKQNFNYFIVEKANQHIGYIALQTGEDSVFLSKLYLLENQRGGELTNKLFEFVGKYAREQHCNTVWLTVNRHNKRAIRAYEKRGFKISKEQVVDIGGGFVMDDFVLEWCW